MGKSDKDPRLRTAWGLRPCAMNTISKEKVDQRKKKEEGETVYKISRVSRSDLLEKVGLLLTMKLSSCVHILP